MACGSKQRISHAVALPTSGHPHRTLYPTPSTTVVSPMCVSLPSLSSLITDGGMKKPRAVAPKFLPTPKSVCQGVPSTL